MNGRQAKKIRKAINKAVQKQKLFVTTEFITHVNKCSLWKRIDLAVRIIFKRFRIDEEKKDHA